MRKTEIETKLTNEKRKWRSAEQERKKERFISTASPEFWVFKFTNKKQTFPTTDVIIFLFNVSEEENDFISIFKADEN